MAFSMKMPLLLFFACSLFLQGTLAEVVCENLGKEQCSYAVSTTGKRCMLEDDKCTTSDIAVEGLTGYVETDECVKACSLDRYKVVESSNQFLTAKFIDNLCAPPCYENCPNILEYYFNLADAEGVFLPALCDPQKSHHRTMTELFTTTKVAAASNEAAAPGPNGAAAGPLVAGSMKVAVEDSYLDDFTTSRIAVPSTKAAAPGPNSAAAAPGPNGAAAGSLKLAVEDGDVDDDLEY